MLQSCWCKCCVGDGDGRDRVIIYGGVGFRGYSGSGGSDRDGGGGGGGGGVDGECGGVVGGNGKSGRCGGVISIVVVMRFLNYIQRNYKFLGRVLIRGFSQNGLWENRFFIIFQVSKF